MNRPIVEFHPEAIEEAREARWWYRDRSPMLAEAFVEELERALRLIEESPLRWPAYLCGTRRLLLRRFPYLMVYRASPERIEIIAVAHVRRRPGYWQQRMA